MPDATSFLLMLQTSIECPRYPQYSHPFWLVFCCWPPRPRPPLPRPRLGWPRVCRWNSSIAAAAILAANVSTSPVVGAMPATRPDFFRLAISKAIAASRASLAVVTFSVVTCFRTSGFSPVIKFCKIWDPRMMSYSAF